VCACTTSVRQSHSCDGGFSPRCTDRVPAGWAPTPSISTKEGRSSESSATRITGASPRCAATSARNRMGLGPREWPCTVAVPILEPAMKTRSLAGALALFARVASATSPLAQEGDPLPSWSSGPAKQAVLTFVKQATDEGGAAFLPVEERIATFDQDG